MKNLRSLAQLRRELEGENNLDTPLSRIKQAWSQGINPELSKNWVVVFSAGYQPRKGTLEKCLGDLKTQAVDKYEKIVEKCLQKGFYNFTISVGDVPVISGHIEYAPSLPTNKKGGK